MNGKHKLDFPLVCFLLSSRGCDININLISGRSRHRQSGFADVFDCGYLLAISLRHPWYALNLVLYLLLLSSHLAALQCFHIVSLCC